MRGGSERGHIDRTFTPPQEELSAKHSKRATCVDQGLPCLAALAANLISATPPALSIGKEKEVHNRTCVLAKPSQAAEATQPRRSGSQGRGRKWGRFSKFRAPSETSPKKHARPRVHMRWWLDREGGFLPAVRCFCWRESLVPNTKVICPSQARCRRCLGADSVDNIVGGYDVDRTTSRHNNEKSRMCP